MIWYSTFSDNIISKFVKAFFKPLSSLGSLYLVQVPFHLSNAAVSNLSTDTEDIFSMIILLHICKDVDMDLTSSEEEIFVKYTRTALLRLAASSAGICAIEMTHQ